MQPAPTSVLRRRAVGGERSSIRPAQAVEPPALEPRRRDDRALRVLLIGAGLDHGWNAGRPTAPAAEIARGVRAITGRPCGVEVVGTAAADPESVVDALGALTGQRIDGAVLAVGAADAMRLTPVADWGARIVDLVDAVQAALPAGAPVLVVGAPSVHVPKRVQPLNPIALRHAARLDRVAQRLAEIRAGVTWVPAPGLAKLVGRRAGADLHAAFGVPVASAFTGALRDGDADGAVRVDRLDLRVLVDVARTDALAVLSGLVRRAAEEFQVAEAGISLFDGERRWRITNHGSGPADAQSLTSCETVVSTDEPLVVADDAGARFPAQTRAGLPLPVFYAGIPVHAADGTAVGAMCLLETDPRLPGSVDLDRLREYAHEAERVIRTVAAVAGWLPPLPLD